MVIRVLHVVTSMDVGGIETMLMNLYRSIDRTKIQFDFLYHRSESSFYDEEIEKLGGRIYRVSPATILGLPTYIKSLRNFFATTCQHLIVHSHVSILSAFVLKEASNHGIPVRIAHSHEAHKSIREHRPSRRPFVLILKPLVNRVCNYRFSCGSEAGRWLFGPREDFQVLTNAIDSQRYVFDEAVRARLRNEFLLRDRFVVGHIGNFTTPKNYPFILKVFKKFLENNSHAVLLLVGRHENNSAVRAQALEMGLDKYVIFTGIRTDVPELLQAMDVFLFPSTFEGLGVALIEAQAASLPCLVSDAVPAEVKIAPALEFMSLRDSPEEWARRLSELGKGAQREDRSGLIAEAGYDIKRNAEWLADFYLQLAEDKQSLKTS